eukprot:603410-Rhodomonas_salina.1
MEGARRAEGARGESMQQGQRHRAQQRRAATQTCGNTDSHQHRQPATQTQRIDTGSYRHRHNASTQAAVNTDATHRHRQLSTQTAKHDAGTQQHRHRRRSRGSAAKDKRDGPPIVPAELLRHPLLYKPPQYNVPVHLVAAYPRLSTGPAKLLRVLALGRTKWCTTDPIPSTNRTKKRKLGG